MYVDFFVQSDVLMRLVLLLFCLAISLIKTHERCYYSGNNAVDIHIENGTNLDTIQIRTILCGFHGYSSFSISNSSSDSNIIYTAILWRDQRDSAFLGVIESNNFTHVSAKILNVESKRRQKGFQQLRQTFVNIPHKHIKYGRYFIFRCHENVKPQLTLDGNFFKIPHPTEISVERITESK